MIIFITLLFLLGFVHTCINISFKDIKYIALFALVLALISMSFLPFAAEINIKNIIGRLNNPNTLSFLCTYQIVESIVLMFLDIMEINNHYQTRKARFFLTLPYLPSGVFLAGMFFAHAGLFYIFTSVEFYLVSLLFSGSIFALLFVVPMAVKKLFTKWEPLMELRIVISFLQIMISMFLPIIAVGSSVGAMKFGVDIADTLLALLVMALLVLSGFVAKKFIMHRSQE